MDGFSTGPIGTIRLAALRQIETLRDRGLSLHQSNVAKLCDILAKAIGLDAYFHEPLKLAAQLHDIGKLAISDRLLSKRGALTDAEIAVMRTHSQIGHDILVGTADPMLGFAAEIALHHHECFDGSGYPHGLKGEAIPLGCRIIAICDVYDALRAERPYHPPMSHEQACTVITAPAGRSSMSTFDPAVMAAFGRCKPEIALIYDPVPLYREEQHSRKNAVVRI